MGIGASAGGLEAFGELLRHLPSHTGMAFVLVQHLSPDHESLLSTLLARTTSLPVRPARDGQRLEPDHIYVIPPAVLPSLKGNTLRFAAHPTPDRLHRVIDYFLGSLAKVAGPRAVGVVLSGTGSDGTAGLRAIQDAGGATLAQSLDSSRFPSMPESAAAAGAVGRALSPRGIAQALAQLAHVARGPRPGLPASRPPASEPDLGGPALLEPDPSGEPQALAHVFQLLKAASGVDFAQYKPNTIHRRISRRMLQCRVDRLSEYAAFIEAHPQELDALQQDLLIHVTSFFRDPDTFEALKRVVFPELLREHTGGAPLRVWVPGCATGEEAYSLAICFLESLPPRHGSPGLQVFATDLSEEAIERARAAVYPASITDSVSPERLRRFFTKTEGGYQLTKAVRNLCIFARQDLVSDPPFSRMDLISCRNVLIYLGPALQRKALSTFHYALNPRGYLVLGSSETVGAAADLFSLREKRHKFYRKKNPSHRPGPFLPPAQPPLHPLDDVPPPAERGLAALDPQKEADRIVLAHYGPPGVIINDELEIIHFRGHTGAFLEPLPGAASLSLLKMARDGLALELRSLVSQARRGGGRVRRERISLQEGKHERLVTLDVRPLRASSGTRERYFLVLFEEVPAPPPAPGAPARGGPALRGEGRRELQRLREELASTREYLQTLLEEQEAAHEELRAANEEAQSTNEELQSTNEELETAKEELQATNEELITVNEELENSNTELSQLNSDLNNLLGSSHITTLMLGSDLRIRRFTLMAESMLRLSRSDIGRPLREIQSSLLPQDLGDAVTQVTENLTVVEREVRDADGRWFLLRLRPYKTLDNRIDGAVMSLLDIDRIKRSLDEVQQAREFSEAIVETMREPFLLLDAALRVVTANPPFYTLFQVTPEQTEGRLLYELGNGQWHIPALRHLLEEVLPRDTKLRDFPVEHSFEHLGPRRFLLNARRLVGENPPTRHILLCLEDVTERT